MAADRAGVPGRLAGTGRDASRVSIKALQRELSWLRQECAAAQQANEAKSLFLATIPGPLSGEAAVMSARGGNPAVLQ